MACANSTILRTAGILFPTNVWILFKTLVHKRNVSYRESVLVDEEEGKVESFWS